MTLPPRDGNASFPSSHRRGTAEECDTCDHEALPHGVDHLDVEAATWVARKRNGLDTQGEEELRAWLDADPRHRPAFDDMDGTFGRLRDMPAEEVEALKAGLDGTDAAQIYTPQPAPRAPSQPASPGRRAWLLDLGWLMPRAALTTGLVGTVGGGWLVWSHLHQPPSFEHTYQTVRGQQLHTTLPDGSSITFDTATHAQVRLYHDRREVKVLQGQAHFSVQANPAQPFHVFAGTLQVTVVGTQFAVRSTSDGLNAGETLVAVAHGRVEVRPLGPDRPLRTGTSPAVTVLSAGQSVRANAQGCLGAVVPVAVSSVAPWREGRLHFDGLPLAQALAEFERYAATGVVVHDPLVAALPVGGSFQVQRMDIFLQSLPRQLPVQLVRRGDRYEVVAAP